MRTALVLTMLLGLAGAAEERWPQSYDMRAFMGVATPLARSNAARFDDAWGYAWGTQGVVRQRLGAGFGALILVGVLGHQHTGEQDDPAPVMTEYIATCGELGVGLFWQGGTRIHFELTPSFRLGRGKVTVEDASGSATGSGDIYWAWNATLGGFYTWPFGLQLGLTAGWSDWTGDSKVAGVTVRSEGAGPQATAVLGYSF